MAPPTYESLSKFGEVRADKEALFSSLGDKGSWVQILPARLFSRMV